MDIRRITTAEPALAAADLFDDPPVSAALERSSRRRVTTC